MVRAAPAAAAARRALTRRRVVHEPCEHAVELDAAPRHLAEHEALGASVRVEAEEGLHLTQTDRVVGVCGDRRGLLLRSTELPTRRAQHCRHGGDVVARHVVVDGRRDGAAATAARQLAVEDTQRIQQALARLAHLAHVHL